MSNHPFRTRTSGFTLIELLISIAIIGILAAIIIPAYKGSIRKANEAAAVAAINSIKIAEAKYAIDHKDQYGSFSQLFAENYLDKRFNTEQPHVRGYIFILTLIDKPERAAVSFQINANPEIGYGVGATGKIFYYSEPDAGIYASKEGPASSNDELL